MSVSTVTKEQFTSFVSALIDSDQKVVGVQAKGDKFAFGDLTEAGDLRLDYDVTILPPKSICCRKRKPCFSLKSAEPL